VSYVAQDPEVDIPRALQSHADRLGKVIAAAQKQGVIDQLPIFAPYHLDQCGWLANRYAEAMPLSAQRKLELLSELDPLKRLESVARLLQDP
jgi:Lon protease-like protein